MNKTELIAAMAEKTGSTKKDAEATLNAMIARASPKRLLQEIRFSWSVLAHLKRETELQEKAETRENLAKWSRFLHARLLPSKRVRRSRTPLINSPVDNRMKNRVFQKTGQRKRGCFWSGLRAAFKMISQMSRFDWSAEAGVRSKVSEPSSFCVWKRWKSYRRRFYGRYRKDSFKELLDKWKKYDIILLVSLN